LTKEGEPAGDWVEGCNLSLYAIRRPEGKGRTIRIIFIVDREEESTGKRLKMIGDHREEA